MCSACEIREPSRETGMNISLRSRHETPANPREKAMTSAGHIAVLHMFVAALIAANVLLSVVVILAWRWRAPGTPDRRHLTFIERKALRLMGEDA
jgi:hypothetical protein